MIGSGKHSSLLRYGNNYCRKKFYSTGPWTKKFYDIETRSKEKLTIKVSPVFNLHVINELLLEEFETSENEKKC